jgi:hypothetical protein
MMLENLKKSMRAFRRDYFDTTSFGAFMGEAIFVMGCIAGGVALFSPAAPAMPFFLGGLLLSGAILTATTVAGRSDAKKNEDAWIDDGAGNRTHLVGPGLKVTALLNTRHIVNDLTRGLSRSPTLPQETQKKLEP